MQQRCARFRHVGLTRLTYARERIGLSPYVVRKNRFRHAASGRCANASAEEAK